jgi:hypothetical protein
MLETVCDGDRQAAPLVPMHIAYTMEVVLTGGSIPYTVNALDAVSVGHSLYLGQPTDIVIKEGGCGLVA